MTAIVAVGIATLIAPRCMSQRRAADQSRTALFDVAPRA